MERRQDQDYAHFLANMYFEQEGLARVGTLEQKTWRSLQEKHGFASERSPFDRTHSTGHLRDILYFEYLQAKIGIPC